MVHNAIGHQVLLCVLEIFGCCDALKRKLSHGCYVLFQTMNFPVTDTREAEEKANFNLKHLRAFVLMFESF